jgi:hypothetical protein
MTLPDPQQRDAGKCLPLSAMAAGFVLALSVAVVPARVAAQEEPLDPVAWLTGCWLSVSGENTTEEVWLRPRGGMMVGMVRSVRGGVATGYELLVLGVVGGRIVLTAFPSGQQPTDFGATSAGPGLLRVENPEHDFPQKIEYRQPAPDSLVATVFADVHDTSAAFAVRYARGACPSR